MITGLPDIIQTWTPGCPTIFNRGLPFGHSLIGQTMTVLDAQGHATQVDLFNAFLNPTNDARAFPVDPRAYYTPKPATSNSV